MKSALHPSSGPPTDASCSCTLLPVCILSLLSAERCHSNVGTPAEFQSGHSEWSSAGMLAGCSDFHGLPFPTAQRAAALDLTRSVTVKQTGELRTACLCFMLCDWTCFNKARAVQHTVYAMRRKQPRWWVALIGSPGGCLRLRVISTQASAPAAQIEKPSSYLAQRGALASWFPSRGDGLKGKKAFAALVWGASAGAAAVTMAPLEVSAGNVIECVRILLVPTVDKTL